jgi:hypothetical protein
VVISAASASAAIATLSYYLSGFWVLTQMLLVDLATKFTAFASTMWGVALIGAAGGVLLYLAWENNLLGIKTLTYDVFAGVARILLVMVQGVINLMWAIAKAGEVFGVFGSGTQKMFSNIAKDLQKTSTEWQRFIDFTSTANAKAGVIQSRPLTDLIKQSIGEIQNYVTTNPANTAPSITSPNITTTIQSLNITTEEKLSRDEIQRAIRTAMDEAAARMLDDIRRYTNPTVRG